MVNAFRWENDEAAASAEAVRRIEAAISSGATELNFRDLVAMTRLPQNLADAGQLEKLWAGCADPFRLGNSKLCDLSSVSALKRLTELELSGTSVTDLRPLASLAGLKVLHLSLMPVFDLSPLANLVGLTEIDLVRTRVVDLGPLARMEKLAKLNLGASPVSDLTPLSGLSELTDLRLTDTKVTNLAPLARLHNLTCLTLQRTQVADLWPLSGLPKLKSLVLPDTQVTDLRFLLSLPVFAAEQAESLSFARTPATNADPHLATLSRLPPLDRVKETVQYLKGTHPTFHRPRSFWRTVH